MQSALPEYSLQQQGKLVAQSIAMLALIHPRLYTIPAHLPFLNLGDTIFEPDFPILRMSGFRAGMAACWKNRLESFNASRLRVATRYTELLAQINGIHLFMQPGSIVPCIRYPLLLDSEVLAKMVKLASEKEGLGIAITYPDAIDALPEINNRALLPCIKARKIARCILTLPCHQLVTEGDIERLVGLLKKALACEAPTFNLPVPPP